MRQIWTAVHGLCLWWVLSHGTFTCYQSLVVSVPTFECFLDQTKQIHNIYNVSRRIRDHNILFTENRIDFPSILIHLTVKSMIVKLNDQHNGAMLNLQNKETHCSFMKTSLVLVFSFSLLMHEINTF